MDDVFTIDLPRSDIVFTRYLYRKDEVRIALVAALLNQSKHAIFWAYELYFSGFVNELAQLIVQIYYDFYATQNTRWSVYLKKQLDCLRSRPTTRRLLEKRHCAVGSIIENLLKQKASTDVFLLRTIHCRFEINSGDESPSHMATRIIEYMTQKNYLGLGAFILDMHNMSELYDAFDACLSRLNPNMTAKDVKRRIKEMRTDIGLFENMVRPSILVLSHLLNAIQGNELPSRGYLRYTPKKLEPYFALYPTDTNSLHDEASLSVDEYDMLSLFDVARKYMHRNAQMHIYNNDWLYQASFSPTWLNRIKRMRGWVDYSSKRVKFISDANEDAFYDAFDYEPDEQTMETKMRANPILKTKGDWSVFVSKYATDNIVKIPEEYIDELGEEQIVY